MASKLQQLFCWRLATVLYGLVCIVGVRSSGDGGEQVAPPTDQSTQVTGDRGAPVRLVCTPVAASAPLPANVTWNRLDRDVLTLNARHRVLANGSLLIRRLLGGATGRPTDEGRYQCALHSDIGTIVGSPISLLMAGPPHIQSMTPDVRVTEGETARFECVVTGHPVAVVTWQKDKQPVDLTDTRYTVLPSGVLQVASVRRSDAGAYRCHAENRVKARRSVVAKLTVDAATTTQTGESMTLLAGPKNSTVSVDDTAFLECAISSTKHRQVTWFKSGGEEVVMDAWVKVVGEANLRIEDVRAEDDDVYTCLVRSKDGSDNLMASAHLTVQQRPFVTEASASAVRYVASVARFRCQFGGWPAPAVIWLKDGRRVRMGRIHTSRADQLVIPQCTAADSGFYQCVGENVAGVAHATMRLYVRSAPDAASRPINLAAETLSSTSIRLSWSQPPSTSNRPTVGFTVHYYIPQGDEPELQIVLMNTTCIVPNLQPHTNYTFYIVHYYRAGASVHSDSVTQVTSEDVPVRAPTLRVEPLGGHSLRVMWEELGSRDARGVITHYSLVYRKHGQPAQHSQQLKAAASTQYVIDGLESDLEYDVYLIAGTSVGLAKIPEKNWQWVTQRTGATASTAKTELEALSMTLQSINSSSLLATWQRGGGGGGGHVNGRVDGYRLTYRRLLDAGFEAGETTIYLKNNADRYVISKLAGDAWYEVQLNSYKDDEDGDTVAMTVQTKPADEPAVALLVAPPGGIEAVPVSEAAIRLSWRRPPAAMNVTDYLVRYSRLPTHNATVRLQRGSSTEHLLVDDLKPHTMYEFVIQSRTATTQGAFSIPIQCRTLAGYPSAPRNPRWFLNGPQAVSLRWQRPLPANGVIVAYTAYYSLNASAAPAQWQRQKVTGEVTHMVVSGLLVDRQYYFKLQAATSKGSGPNTLAIAIRTQPYHDGSRPHNTSTAEAMQPEGFDRELGIIVGVAICVSFIIIFIVIVLLRNCWCCMRRGAAPSSHATSNGHARMTPDESAEVDSCLPMADMTTFGKDDKHQIYDEYGQRRPRQTVFAACNGRPHSNGRYPVNRLTEPASAATKAPLLPDEGDKEDSLADSEFSSHTGGDKCAVVVRNGRLPNGTAPIPRDASPPPLPSPSPPGGDYGNRVPPSERVASM